MGPGSPRCSSGRAAPPWGQQACPTCECGCQPAPSAAVQSTFGLCLHELLASGERLPRVRARSGGGRRASMRGSWYAGGVTGCQYSAVQRAAHKTQNESCEEAGKRLGWVRAAKGSGSAMGGVREGPRGAGLAVPKMRQRNFQGGKRGQPGAAAHSRAVGGLGKPAEHHCVLASWVVLFVERGRRQHHGPHHMTVHQDGKMGCR
jgi:hypothetical protein